MIRFCHKLLEAGWLIALITIPLFFNPYSARVFEADKTYVLIALAVLMFACLVVTLAAEGVKRSDPKFGWLVVTFLIVYIISSFLSIMPGTSFDGFYLREEGWVTLYAYFIIFTCIATSLRSAEQVERIITTAVMTGFVVALYGIFQKYGIDTVAWSSSVATRVTSTMGNPIFAGAFLIMVIPLTLGRFLMRIVERARNSVPPRRERDGILRIAERNQNVISAILYGVILIVQAWCVIATQSRGPFIGLMAGVTTFLILYALVRRFKALLLGTLALIIMIGIFLALINISGSPLNRLKPQLGRLGEVAQTETGSGKVRLLIWEGAVKILAAEPARLFFGYGLETMFPLYHKYIPGQFARYEGTSAVPDHSHNDTFDILITGGALGLVAYLAIIAGIIYLGLKRLELIRQSPAQFISVCLIGIGAGIFVPYLITGKLIFLGLGIPFGMLFAIGCWVLILGFKSSMTANSELNTPNSLLIIALLSAVISHFVEIQFGIGVTSTRLYFWVYLALLAILLAVSPYRVNLANPTVKDMTAAPDTPDTNPLPRYRHYLTYSLLSGLMISILIFILFRRKHLTEGIPDNLYIIIGTVWLLLGLFIILNYPPTRKDPSVELGIGHYFNRYLLILLLSGLCAGVLYLVYSSLLAEPSALESLISLAYIWFNIILIILAVLLTAGQSPVRISGWTTIVMIILIPFTYITVYHLTIKKAYADMYCHQGENLEKSGKYPESIISYKRALELAPKVDYYCAELARAQQRAGNYTEAESTLKRAISLNPGNPFHYAQIARLYADWSGKFPADSPERTTKLNSAFIYYGIQAVLTPTNPQVYREMGEVYERQGDYRTAVLKYQLALKIDDQLGDIWFRLGKAFQQGQDVARMIDAYERAFKLGNKQPRAELGKLGEDYFNSGRYQDSIQVNLALSRIEPKEYQHYNNLAVVYEKINQRVEALKYSQQALDLAPPDKKHIVEQFRERLKP